MQSCIYRENRGPSMMDGMHYASSIRCEHPKIRDPPPAQLGSNSISICVCVDFSGISDTTRRTDEEWVLTNRGHPILLTTPGGKCEAIKNPIYIEQFWSSRTNQKKPEVASVCGIAVSLGECHFLYIYECGTHGAFLEHLRAKGHQLVRRAQ